MIEVSELKKTYGAGVEAVKGISFEVEAGEVFGLLGPNGAGKSTTMGLPTTTSKPTSGSAIVAGHDVARHPLAARAASGIVFQEAVVDRALSGRRNLDVHARLWGVGSGEIGARIDEAAGAFRVAEILDRPVSTYSGGQRRRLEIARALLSEPQVLFLDEPTVGLDPRIRYELLDLVGGLREQGGMTVLLTTHYLDEAERLCDRVAIIHDGAIVAIDTPDRLIAGLGAEIVELRVEHDAHGAMSALRAGGIASDDALSLGSTLTIPLHERAGHEALVAIAELGLATTEVAARRTTLDDVYLRLTGTRLAA